METMDESHLMRLMNSSPHAALMSPVQVMCQSATPGFGNAFSSKKRGLDVLANCETKRETIKFDQPLDFSKKPKMEVAEHIGSPTRMGSDDEEAVLNLCRDTEGRDNYMSDSGASSATSESPEIDRLRAASGHMNGHMPVHPPTPPMFGHLGPLHVSPGSAPDMGPAFPMGVGVGVGPAATSPVFPQAVPVLQNVITGKGPGGKVTRPFKAYPRDPLSISMGMYTLPMSLGGMTPTEAIINQASNDAYSKFRERMMSSVQAAKSTRRCSKSSTSPTSDRHGSTSPDHGEDSKDGMMRDCQQKLEKGELGDPNKDDAYWERRRKNNEAAKRSRDARRAKEDEIAIRAAFLEQENLKLRIEVAALKNETAKLRCLLYNS